MKLRRFIQEQLFAGPSFQIPRGYFFVRRCTDRFASEYWVWPLHWMVRFYYWLWGRWYRFLELVVSKALAKFYGKKKKKTH